MNHSVEEITALHYSLDRRRKLSFLPVRVICFLSFLLLLSFSNKLQAQISSTAAGGPWNSTATWVGGVIPGSTDDVIIVGGATVTVDAGTNACQNLTITGTLDFDPAVNLDVNGDWTNNGSFNAGTGSVTFRGAGNSTISGNAITTFNDIIVNKGTGVTSVLESNGIGAISNTGVLTLTNGILEITNGTFDFGGITGPTIPASAGLWVNGGTLLGGPFTVDNRGWIRVSAGTANFGTNSGNSLHIGFNGYFDVSGGTVNIAGRLENAASSPLIPSVPGNGVSISGGTINLNTVGQSDNGLASFDMTNTSELHITGGTIIIENPNSNATPFNDINIISGGTKSITGGTFQIGNASTATGRTFLINSGIPLFNLTINNTNNPRVSLNNDLTINNQLTLNGHLLLNNENLILGSTAPAINGTLAANAGMIVSNNGLGGGEVRKLLTGNGSFTFPVGDITGTAEYSPVTLTFTSGAYAAGAYAGVKVINTKHPNNANTTDYINRYWNLSTSGITGPIYNVVSTYVPADVVGAETNVAMGKYTALPWVRYGAANTGSNQLTANAINFTGLAIGFSGITLATPTVTIDDISICEGSSIQLNPVVTGDPTITYAWTSAPAGFNSTLANPTLNPTVTTTYTLTITDGNGLTASDDAIVTVIDAATSVAGTPVVTCSNSGAVNITAGSSATNNNGITWTSSGTGTFANANSLTIATYTPSAVDIAAGSVTLTLTAIGNAPCVNATSTKTLTITAAPTAVAGTAITTCSNSPPVNITAGSSATNNAGTTWTSTGTGTFANANSLTNATYAPSAADIAAGSVTITLTAAGNGTCPDAISTKTLTINDAPTANAGTAVATCSNSGAVNITTGSSAANNNGITWTSTGTGTFANANSLTTATYTPSAADIAAGSVTITLTAIGNAPCADATSTKTLTITAAPTAVAGTPVTTCSNSAPVNITAGSSATNNGGTTWTSSGTGTFANANSLTTATYTPSAADIAAGSVTITLTASGNGTCADAVSTKTLTINAAPTAVAGTAVSTCSNTGAINITAGSSATNHNGVNWSSSGTGTFANANSLTTATYTPSAADIAAGSVTLTLTATGNAPCANATSIKTLTITQAPTSIAGTAVVTCSNGGAVNITAGSSATNNNGVNWTSSGTGTFANANSLTTATYTPSAADIAAGSVTLTLTATGNAPCANATSTKTLTINAAPSASATSNSPRCVGQTLNLNSLPAGATSYSWTGPNSFTANVQNPTIANVTTAAAGSYIVTVSNGAGCSAAATVNVVVNALPTATISYVGAPFCVSVPGTRAVTITGGPFINPSFSAAPATGLSLNTTTGGIIPSSSTPGTYIVTYNFTSPTTNCSNTTTVSVTINALPTVTSPASVCVGGSGTLSPTTGGTWVSNNPGNASVTNAGVITGIAPGTATFTFTDALTGCTRTTNSVTVNALPAVTAPASVCVSGNATLSPTTGGTWVSNSPGNATVTNAGVITGVAPGSATFTFTSTATGCSNTTSAVTVNGLPGVTAPAAVCVGGTASLTPNTGGTWVSNNPANATVTSVGVITGVAAGTATFTFTQTSTGCTSTTSPVTINALPTVTAPTSVCVGGTGALSPNTGGTWVSNNTSIATVTAGGVITGVAPGSTTFTFTQTSTGCSRTSPSVTVNALPTVTSPAGICVGGTGNLTPNSGGTWVSNAPGIASVSNAGVITGLAPGTATFTFTQTSTGCTRTTNSVAVSATPIVSISADYCAVPGRVRLMANVSNSPPVTGPFTYTWSTNPIQPLPTTQTIDVDIVGAYTVVVTSSSGCSGTASINVSNELVQNGNFSAGNTGFFTEYTNVPLPGTNACCAGMWPEGTYAVNTNANAYHANFWGREHSTVGQTGNFLMINGSTNQIGAPPHLRVIWQETVTIQPNTDYYFSAWAMNLNPASPARLRFEINGVQVGTIADLTVAPTPTNAGQVSVNNWVRFYSNPVWNSGAATTAQIRIINLNLTAGGNDFGLDDISFGTLTSFLQLTSPFGSDGQTVCENTPIANISYSYGSPAVIVDGLPPGLTTNVVGNVITISGTPVGSGVFNYSVTTTGSCTQIVKFGSITINPAPTLTIVDPPAACSPSTVDITTTAVQTFNNGNTTTYWFNAAGTTAIPAANGTPTAISVSGTYYIKSVFTSTGCSIIRPVVVTVNPVPTLTVVNPPAVCSPATVDITTTSVQTTNTGTTTTYWSDAAATVSLASPNAISTSGTYYIKSALATGCFVIRPVTVTINPIPTLTIVDPPAVCAPTTVNITTSSVQTANTGTTTTYWSDAAGTIAIPAGNGTPAALTVGGTYYIRSSFATGCFVIRPVIVTINPKPNLVITNPPAVCSPATADLTAAAVTAGSTLLGGTLTYWTDAPATITYTTPTTATAGTYYIKVTTALGCTDVKPVVVTVNSTPAITPQNACIGGGNITFAQTGGGAGGTWSVSGGGTIVAGTGVFTPGTAGCFNVTYTTSSGCPGVLAFTVFPAAPALTIANTCNAAFTLPTLPTVAGFTAQFSIDGGTFSATPTVPTSVGCHQVRARYVLAADCGTTLAGTAGTGTCGETTVGVIIFPSAPTITAPANACNAQLTINTTSVPVPTIAGFSIRYSVDGGSFAASVNIAAASVGCHSIQAKYVLAAACGGFPPGFSLLTGPCANSNTVNVIMFPPAPAAPTLNAGCGAILVTPPPNVTVTAPATGTFTAQYSFDDGATWGANTPPTADNCAGYRIRTRYVTTAACGTVAANTASIIAACQMSPATIRTVDLTGPVLTCPGPVNLCTVPSNNYTIPVVTGIDACGGTITYTYQVTGATTRSGTGNDASGTFNQGISTITWTGTDPCGNTSQCTTTVTIASLVCNITGPDNVCPGSTNIYTAPAGMTTYSWSITAGTATISGSATGQTVSIVAPATCSSYTLSLTITNNGCSSTCTQVFSATDITPPTASNPAPINLTGCNAAIPAPDITVVTDEADNCGIPTVAFVSDATALVNCVETTTRTYRVTDICNNTINVTQTITRTLDNTLPTASNPAAINLAGCNAAVPAPDITVVTDEADNCGTPVVAFVSDATSLVNCVETVTRIYSVTDACNNTINVTQIITRTLDNTPPTASNPAAITLAGCNAAVPAPDITVVTDEADNCGTPVVAFVSDATSLVNCVETTTRTYSVTDACNNTINVTQVITRTLDNTPPTASNPAAINLAGCNAAVPAPDVAVVTDEADNCGTPVVAFVSDATSLVNCIETTTRTYSVTDACNNTINVTQIITRTLDNTPPTASNPAPINLAGCNAAVPAPDITVVTDEADNCGTPVVAFVSDAISLLNCVETITRIYSVTDACNNTINVTQIITRTLDNTPPTASNPAAINLAGCNAAVPAPDITVVTDEADNCGIPVVAFVSDAASLVNCVETITRTYSVTDACNNSITVTQLITRTLDNTPPTASNPATINLAGCNAAVPAPDITVVTDEADNCGTPVVAFVSDATSLVNCVETTTRTYSVTDACNNSITVTQLITRTLDNTPPTASDPAPINLAGCNAAVPAPDITVVTDEADNCGTPVVAFVSDATSLINCVETITRIYSVTDACNNTINVTQIITRTLDNTPPTASDPAPINLAGCNAAVPAPDITVVTDEADNCGTPVVAFVSDAISLLNCVETITRIYSVTDACNNTINVTQIITRTLDNTPPTASDPAPINLAGCNAAVPAPDIAVVTDEADNCGALVVAFVSDATSLVNCVETTTRTYSVTDACNNSITVTQLITRTLDNTPPTASDPAPINLAGCNAAVPAPDITVVTDEADNCGTPVVAFVSDATSLINCVETITRIYSVTDACNNTINVTQIITRTLDNTPPTASDPAPINLAGCNAAVPAPDITVVTDEADNCGTPVVAFVSDAISLLNCVETITRIYSVTDACNNTINVSQIITRTLDNTPPTASNPAAINLAGCNAAVPAPDITVVTDEADNCGIPVVAFVSDATSLVNCVETTTRTYSVTDACNNSITVTQLITRTLDNTPPTASDPAPINLAGCNAAVPAPDITVVTDEADNCGTPVVAFVSDATSLVNCVETITRIYSVTDACNNTINVTQIITRTLDNTPPTASDPAPINLAGCNAAVPAPDITVVTDEADNCGTPVVAFVSDAASLVNCVETITRTYSVTDACNNSIAVTQLITRTLDNTPPTASNPAPINLAGCNAAVPAPDITVVTDEADNCGTPVVAFVSDATSLVNCVETTTRTYSVTDACNNSITVTQLITRTLDNTPPTASDPAPINLAGCNAAVPAPDITVVTDEADNCGTPVVAFVSDATSLVNCVETITRIYSVTDACNNTINVTQIITRTLDNTPPTASDPAPINLAGCNAAVPGPDIAVVTDEADNCGTPVVAFVSDATSLVNCVETITRIYSVTDACNNSITVTQLITRTLDNTPPTASDPAPINLAGCNAAVPAPDITVVTDEADNCGIPVVAFVSDATSLVNCVETTTRTYSVTDACNNTINVIQIITRTLDNTPPTASNPAPINLAGCNAAVPAPDITVVTDEADNCGTPVVAFVSDATSLVNCVETITRIYSVTDACNNTINVTQIITRTLDNTPPTASDPAPINLAGCNAAVPAPDITVVTDEADNCGIPVVAFVSDATSLVNCVETTTRTYSVTDACNNTINVTQLITRTLDNTPPTASDPAPINLAGCNAAVPAPDITVVTDEADNCGTPVVAFVSDATSLVNCVETITRIYSVTDACNNTINVTQIITRTLDNTPPTASDPAPINLAGCNAAVPAPDITVVTDEADNCGTPVVAFVSDATSLVNCVETITRTYSVTDACNNSITVTQIITRTLDNTPPTASDPAPINLAGCNAAVPAPDITVVTDEADNCGTPVVAFVSDATSLVNCVETTTRTYSVTDACNNTINVIQLITRTLDNTPPTASDPAPINLAGCNAAVPAPDIAVVTDEADNCGTPVVAFVSDATSLVNCVETITRIYSVTDACNNTINVTQIITRTLDNTPPTASDPAPINLAGCNAAVPAPDITVVTDEADNCGIPVVAFVSDATSLVNCVETITRTYSVTDACNNTINVTQIITRTLDNTPPTASDPAPINLAGCNAAVPAPDITVVTDEADNCGIPVVAFVSDATSLVNCVETTTRTYSVTDACNNSITVTQLITRTLDNTPPTASDPAPINLAGCNAAVPAPDIAVVTDEADNCGIPVVAFVSDATSLVNCVETITRIYSVTDACNNTINVTQIITRTLDNTPPTASDPAPINLAGCNAAVPASDITVVTDEADNCGIPVVAFVSDATSLVNCVETITRIYSVTDACNNTINVTQIITRTLDNTPPTASDPAPINLAGCNAAVPAPDIAVVTDEADNCGIPVVAFVSDATSLVNCVETTTRTYSVTDACNNSITVTQLITRTLDNTPPTASDPAPINLAGCNAAVPAPDITVVTDEADNCGTPVVAFVSDATSLVNCVETITRIYSVTDACNNTINVTQIITRTLDNTPPTASDPAPINLAGCNAAVPAPDITVVTDEADNCGTPVVAFVSDATSLVNCVETITRTYSVTDACNNTINVTQIITRTLDNTPPTASDPAPINLAGCNAAVPAPDIAVVTDAADNCGIPVVAFVSDATSLVNCVETTTRTYSVTDACNNSITVTQLITRTLDNTPPTASDPAPINLADVMQRFLLRISQ